MQKEDLNYKYLILVNNKDALKYLHHSFTNRIHHYYYVNRSSNHFDYYNLTTITDETPILFVECNKQYEIIRGFTGIGIFNHEHEHLDYSINKIINRNESELDILNLLDIDVEKQFSNHNLIINIWKKMKPYNDSRFTSSNIEIHEKLLNLEFELYEQQPVAFNTYYELRQKYYSFQPITTSSVLSFHSIIGAHNNTFADCVNNKFATFEDFIVEWEKGLYLKYQASLDKPYNYNSTLFLIRLFQNDIVQKYIYTFLERNFYRNYKERTREKPAKNLTELYIGDNTSTYQLLITPTFRRHTLAEEKHWENDVSEIRRCNFTYWTIPHLLNTGYISNNRLYKTPTMQDILNLYKTFHSKSNSPYEKAFIERYANYIKKHIGENIPLLIPEFRYGGVSIKHLYRLDFLIINVYDNIIVGIELSPNYHILETSKSSTIEKWEYEIAKRNSFFETYKITTITYTSKMLENIEDCWNKTLPYLQPINECFYPSSHRKLMNICFNNI